MKKKKFVSIGIIIFICLSNNYAFSHWQAVIHAEGEKLEGQVVCDVIIGVDSEADSKEAPPTPPPIYTVHMLLYQMNWNGPFLKDIRKEGEESYSWFICIDPHGNATTQPTAKSVISWDPDEFGPGSYSLQEGYDGTGPIVVSDMKSVNSYSVTGANTFYYFILTYTPDKEDDPPAISAIPDQITKKNTTIDNINFTLSDKETSPDDLNISISSSNPLLVSKEKILITGNGIDRSLVITPENNKFGSTIITISVNDDTSSVNETFKITIMPELSDIINILQILSGMVVQNNLMMDINGDQKIDMTEGIYLFKILSNLMI